MNEAIDLFCGIGWGFACAELGIAEYGIDNEPTVIKTRDRLGWDGSCVDVLDIDPKLFVGVDGLIASPPCQSWSRAGKGMGLDDPRGQLVWQPLVWALAIRPRWVACEQVPEARGAFELIAHRLREVGYLADVYELSAECFGVAQTRRRVFFVAHRDRAPHRPQPTHQRYRKGRARVEPVDMLGLLPWVSMAEALGDLAPAEPWLYDPRQSWANQERRHDEPTPTVTAASGGKSVAVLRYRNGGYESGGKFTDYPVDQPSPTLPAHIGKDGDSWAWHRPSTTVCADPRVSAPAHHDGSQNAGAVPYTEAGADKPVALTEAQGCALMGFPPGTAELLEGNKQDRWRIIGNAVCPPVGRAVLETVVTP